MADDSDTTKRKRGRPRGSGKTAPSNTVLALDRGLNILEAVAHLQSATLGELAAHVAMPASTVHRILATLQSHGFVSFETAVQEWAIGIGAFRVGSAFLARANLVEESLKVMLPLMEQTGETANLGIPEGGNIVFVSQVETNNPIRALFRQGTGSPMHASGIGKTILADMAMKDVVKLLEKSGQPAFTSHTLATPAALFEDLAHVEQRGWAIDNEERYMGMRCVAAAVYNAQGKAIAGLSVSGPTARFSDAVVAKTGPQVARAARALTEIIGGKAP